MESEISTKWGGNSVPYSESWTITLCLGAALKELEADSILKGKDSCSEGQLLEFSPCKRAARLGIFSRLGVPACRKQENSSSREVPLRSLQTEKKRESGQEDGESWFQQSLEGSQEQQK